MDAVGMNWIVARLLCEDGSTIEVAGNAFKVTGAIADAAISAARSPAMPLKSQGPLQMRRSQLRHFLRVLQLSSRAIEKKEKLTIAASKIDIYSLQESISRQIRSAT
eukprot:s16375_g1.t1